MSREKIAAARRLLVLIVLVSIHARFDAQAPPTRGLESFYVTFTDYRILHVRPAGSGVSVRAIQMHYLEESCWTRVMRAYDVNLADTTVQAVASVNVCALSQRRIDDALDRSRENVIRGRDGIPWGTYFDSVVAVCNGRERRFLFDYGGTNAGKPGIDATELRRVDRAVYELWTLGRRVVSRVAPLAPSGALQEEQGTAAAAELIGGRYDTAFRDACWEKGRSGARCEPGFWSQVIGKYSGPPQHRGPLPVEILERDAFTFSHYVAAEFPPIALSARVFGDVKVRLTADRATGAVTDAIVVEGQPLIKQAALNAAKQWRFAAGTAPSGPFDVTFRFELKCAPR